MNGRLELNRQRSERTEAYNRAAAVCDPVTTFPQDENGSVSATSNWRSVEARKLKVSSQAELVAAAQTLAPWLRRKGAAT
jgi:hypothetical protein